MRHSEQLVAYQVYWKLLADRVKSDMNSNSLRIVAEVNLGISAITSASLVRSRGLALSASRVASFAFSSLPVPSTRCLL